MGKYSSASLSLSAAVFRVIERFSLYEHRKKKDINFQLSINQIMSSRAPNWIHMKYHQFSIENQKNNEL